MRPTVALISFIIVEERRVRETNGTSVKLTILLAYIRHMIMYVFFARARCDSEITVKLLANKFLFEESLYLNLIEK